MQEINLDTVQKIYFVGIGGIAMSATAGIAKAKGFECFGSDEHVYSPSLEVLQSHDIDFFRKFSEENIKATPADLYVVSAGVLETNPEYAYILAQEFAVCSFPELLKGLANDNIRIVVAGTHGKSTTTGMLGATLNRIEDSSFMSGGVLVGLESNFAVGEGNYFVFEGDEYKSRSDDPTPKFHYYKPDLLVLTNLEYDHPDMFSTPEQLEDEFEHLLANLPDDGVVIFNADDAALERLVFRSGRPGFSYGTDPAANVRIVSATTTPEGTIIDIHVKFNETETTEKYATQLYGEMNVYNALAVVTLLRALGFTPELIAQHLVGFKGIKRRFEVLGEAKGVTVVDDYAHHPTAVVATLAAARKRFAGKRVWAVFEPHTFSRTKALREELASCFTEADRVLIAPIYAAREPKSLASSISNKEIVADIISRDISLKGDAVRIVESKENALDILKSEAKPGDVVIVMAVGDFNTLGKELLEVL